MIDLIFAVMFLYFKQVIAKVENIKAPMLSQQSDDHAPSPVQAISEALPGEGAY